MALVRILVSEAEAPDMPVAGASIRVFQAFADDPAQFLGPWPPLRFAGLTGPDGTAHFDAVTGADHPTPHLVVVKRSVGGVELIQQVIGQPGGEVIGPDGLPMIELRVLVGPDAPIPPPLSAPPEAPTIPPSAPSEPSAAEPTSPATPASQPPGPTATPAATPVRRLGAAVAGLGLAVVAMGVLVLGLILDHRSPGHRPPIGAPTTATAAYTGGQGGCLGLPLAFSRAVIVERDGAAITLVQPSAHDTATGTTGADGAVTLGNGAERYQLTWRGKVATGLYRITDPRTRCSETYAVTVSPDLAGRAPG